MNELLEKTKAQLAEAIRERDQLIATINQRCGMIKAYQDLVADMEAADTDTPEAPAPAALEAEGTTEDAEN